MGEREKERKRNEEKKKKQKGGGNGRNNELAYSVFSSTELRCGVYVVGDVNAVIEVRVKRGEKKKEQEGKENPRQIFGLHSFRISMLKLKKKKGKERGGEKEKEGD